MPVATKSPGAIHVARYESAEHVNPRRYAAEWGDVVEMLSTHRRTTCGPCAGKKCQAKNGPAFSFAEFEGTRKDTSVTALHAFAFDIDHGDRAKVDQTKALLASTGVACVLSSTHCHKPDAPKLRLVVQSSRPVPPAQYKKLWRLLNARFEINADESAKDLSRIFFEPSAPEGAPVEVWVNDGEPLNVDDLLTQSESAVEVLVRTFPPAVEGNGGDAQTLQLGMRLRDHGLSEDEAWPLMQRFNERCTPPWSEGELRKKLSNAYRYAKNPPGSKLIDEHHEHSAYRLTDVGNAERFRDRERGRVMFIPQSGKWLVFNGRWWVEDSAEAMRRMIVAVRAIYAHASKIENEELRKATASWARQSESASKLEGALRIARNLDGITVNAERLDNNPWLLNVQNGTIDLRTGELRPHEPRDLITGHVPIDFDPAATCPSFGRYFVRVVPSPAVRGFLQRWVGYCLTGLTREQVMVFLLGVGANGKTVFMNSTQSLLGSYARPGAPDLLLARGNEAHPTELANLLGARLIVCSEIEEGRRFAEARFKELTGGDRISARFLHRDFFSFWPTFKIMVAANHRPVVRTGGEAIWRRIRLVPFDVVIPENERDPDLVSKLEAEASGLLNWAVQGCRAWQQEGLGHPEEIAAATDAYRASQDDVARFLEELVEPSTNAWVSSNELHAAYRQWCQDGGEYWKSKEVFGERLKAAGFLAQKRKGIRGWAGLRMRGFHRGDAVDAVTPSKPDLSLGDFHV